MATASGSVLLLGDPSAFAAALKTLINNPQFSDVTFLVGKKKQKVFAHRCLLSTRCQVLHAMLSQPHEIQVPLILNHIQPEVFLTVIEYLYTNGVTLNNLTALEVLTSSIEYGLNDLRKLCIEFIKDSLNVNQACEAFQAAVAYGLLDLQTYCLAFIENYTQEVTQTRGFLELSEQAMQIILQSDCLAIDEVKLIHTVREWAHVGSAVLDRTVHDMAQTVVPQLRLALLSPRELTSLEEENKKDQMIPHSVQGLAEKCGTVNTLLLSLTQRQTHIQHGITLSNVGGADCILAPDGRDVMNLLRDLQDGLLASAAVLISLPRTKAMGNKEV